jgi:hypothetical protein
MDLQIVKGNFSVFKVTEIDPQLLKNEFTFVSTTDQELSIICETKYVPENTITVEHGWSCFRIAEDASFAKYGMIAFLSKIIADLKTSILVVGTFDTDYIFIQDKKFDEAIRALEQNGCRFI